MSEPIGIHLIDGPGRLNGWRQVYDLGTRWPAPDFIAAFEVADSVAVALPEKVPDAYMHEVTWYRKIGQSTLDEPTDLIVRGAEYASVGAESVEQSC
jgi:hypothetical protein